MIALTPFLWGWYLASVLLGFGVGWIAVVHRGRVLDREMLRRIAVVLAVCIAVAVTRMIPGRPGYWLDLGLVMFALYLVGCAVGSALRARVVARHSAAT